MFDLMPVKVNLKNAAEREKVETFLKQFDLNLDNDVDYTIVIKNSNSNIIAACSKAENIFKCFAVKPEYRGKNLTSILIKALIDKCFEEKIYHYFIFTKPENIEIFQNANFKLIDYVDKAALLESGIYTIKDALEKLKKDYKIDDCEKSAVVMNCNPFTLGHKYLIEEASKISKEVLIFILQEDKSIFPFKVRYNLVKDGTKHLKNVKIINSTEYIISSATFPSYFIKEQNSRLNTYTMLDSKIFGKYFCGYFNITKRFAGEEPYCNVTKTYNNTMKKILKKYNVELVEIKRSEFNNVPISASSVRKMIKQDKIKEAFKILPKVTVDFLKTKEGNEIMEKIKSSTPVNK